MNLKRFTAILLESISNSDIAPVNIERYQTDNHSFCVTTDDEQIFLVKVGEIHQQDMIINEKSLNLNVTAQLGIETRDDFLETIDAMVQKNPLLMNLLFSTWKLRELNLISDSDLDRIQKGLEKNKDSIFIDFIQQQEMMDK